MKHKHRILPGHIGGEYVEGNVISVEATECDKQTANHVMWHYANWQLWNKVEDLIAWKGLSGYYSKEEIIQRRLVLGGKITGAMNRESGHIQRIGKEYGEKAMSPGGWLYENRAEYGKLGGAAVRDRKLGIFSLSSEDFREIALRNYKNGLGIASMSPEEKKQASQKGGICSGEKHKQNRTGVCGIPPEEHSNRISKTNKQRWECPLCGYTNIARHVNKHMLGEHNLPKSSKLKSIG